MAAKAAAKGILANAIKAASAASRAQMASVRSLQPAQAGFAVAKQPLGAALAASLRRTSPYMRSTYEIRRRRLPGHMER